MNKTISMLAAIAFLLVCEINSLGTIKEKASPRKLGFDFNVDKTFYIRRFYVAGQYINCDYRVAVQNGKAINQIIIYSNQGSFTFGNDGVDSETSNTWSGKIRIFTFRFPQMPTITLGLIAQGSLSYTVKYASASKDSLQITLTGDLKAGVEVVSGPGKTAKIYTGAEGTLISSSCYATVTKNDIVKRLEFYGSGIDLWVEARAKIPFIGEKKLWKKTMNFNNQGWSSKYPC